jgi:hypothetical protein
MFTAYLVVSILSAIGIIGALYVLPFWISFTESYTFIMMSPELEALYIEFPFQYVIVFTTIFLISRLMKFASFSVKLGLSLIIKKIQSIRAQF